MTKDVMQLLAEVNESMLKMKEKSDNSRRGYEPKCKICNSDFQDEIDEMYEWEKPFREIKEFLEDKGEAVSQMALSRHYRNHYPTRRVYLDNIKKMEDESIQKAIKYYPHLEVEFQETVREPDWDNMELNEEGTGFKETIWIDRPKSDIFLNDHGYCMEDYRLCDNVPKKEVHYMEDTLSKIDENIRDINRFYNDSAKIDLLNKKIKCLDCRNSTNNYRMEFIMQLLLKKFYDIDLEEKDTHQFLNTTFSDILFSVDFDLKEIDKLLNKLKK